MSSQQRNPQSILREKILRKRSNTLRLNRRIFNFLENLIIFCISEEYQVPAESGVCFLITPTDDGVCLLFHIDRRINGTEDGVIPPNEIKPDYMAFYVNKERCICTIIEMKGRECNNLKHGIEQIKALKDILVEQIREHMPSSLRNRIIIQGILLAQPNAQLPAPILANQSDEGLEILLVTPPQKAELFQFISKENSWKDRYTNEDLRDKKVNNRNWIEKMLVRKSLHERFNDRDNVDTIPTPHTSADRQGVNVHFALENDGEYVVMILSNNQAQILIREQRHRNANRIRDGLKKLRLHRQVTTRTLAP